MTPERRLRLKSQKKLLAYIRKNKKAFLAFQGVHRVDAGYKFIEGQMTDKLCIRFHVYKKHRPSYLGESIIPAAINGFETDVIVSNPINNSRQGVPYNPLIGGIEVENANGINSGTLACILYDNNNQLVGLTNRHVLVSSNTQPNDPVIQPAKIIVSNADIIGNMYRVSAQYDCATFLINNSRAVQPLVIYGFQSPISQQTAIPVYGDRVKKSGMISEITYGIIDGSSTEGWFSIVSDPQADNQGPIVQEGDSGSLWVLSSNVETVAVGLHYQSNPDFTRAFAFSINLVLNKLGLHF